MSELEKSFDAASAVLPVNIRKSVLSVPGEIKKKAMELRLRINSPLRICCSDDTYYLTQNGCVSNSILNQPMLAATLRDIGDTFNSICDFSVYSRQNEIKNGFITLKGGHRAGICGTAVFDRGEIINIRDISSINIRISAQHKDCSREILREIRNFSRGALICGAPCSGKTTALRDMARLLSTEYRYKVSLLDERGELAGMYRGECLKDVGMCDVFNGYGKSDGFAQAIRCMSPDIIICDEIGSVRDIASVENALNSGVSVIASVHCSCREELLCKPGFKQLINTRAFSVAVFLQTGEKVGRVSHTVNCDELYI